MQVTEEEIDDIVDRIMKRLREIRGGIYCRRCDNRLGFEDPWALCVTCQSDLGKDKLNKIRNIKTRSKR